MLALDKISLPAQEDAFRSEVRAFLAAELTDSIKQSADAGATFLTSFSERGIALEWQAKLLSRRWLAFKVPFEHGGSGWTSLQHFIFETEAGLAGAPFLPGFGLLYLGPVLAEFGTEAQKREWIPRILQGDDYWCQGFSEPGSGSDLASLQCAARREGEEYVIDGSKIWTSQGQLADHIFCLVRTSREERPQKGISFLLVDLRLPGVTIRPIRMLGGDDDFNQVFFDGVRVPATALVGQEGDGWRVAKYLLELERGGFIMSGHVERRLRRLKRLLEREVELTGPMREISYIEARIAELDIAVLNFSHLELKCVLDGQQGWLKDVQASVLKIAHADLEQQINDAALDVLGPAASYLCEERPLRSTGEVIADRDYLQPFVPTMLNERGLSIEGGSNEVQRNLIARAVLG